MNEPIKDCPYCYGHGFTIVQVGVDEFGDAIGEQEQCQCASIEINEIKE